VARRAPSKLGAELATLARRSFVSGMDEALLIATAVVGVAALVILLSLPNHGSEFRKERLERRRGLSSVVDHRP